MPKAVSHIPGWEEVDGVKDSISKLEVLFGWMGWLVFVGWLTGFDIS